MLLRMLGFALLVAFLALVVILVLRARDAVVDRAAQPAPNRDRRQQHALEQARRQLRRAEKGHARRVRAARKEVDEAGRDVVLARVGPVVLGACTLTVRETVHELSPSTTFRVDVEGEVRQVVLRRGDREQTVRDDQREVYLTLTDDTWGDVVRLDPTQLEGARRLEVAGAAAVRNLQTARAERDARVEAAQEARRRVEVDTGEVDTARMTVEDLAGLPRPIEVPDPPAGDIAQEPPGEGDDPDPEDGPPGAAPDRG